MQKIGMTYIIMKKLFKIVHCDICDEGLENCAESRIWLSRGSRREAVSVGSGWRSGEKAPGCWRWDAAAGGADGRLPVWSTAVGARRALPGSAESAGGPVF